MRRDRHQKHLNHYDTTGQILETYLYMIQLGNIGNMYNANEYVMQIINMTVIKDSKIYTILMTDINHKHKTKLRPIAFIKHIIDSYNAYHRLI